MKRLALIPLVLIALVLTTAATLTFAAAKTGKPSAKAHAVKVKTRKTIVVPNVLGQAYVFAKGVLEDSGFAWRLRGAKGYAANLVTAQSPAGGTIVVDSGAPTVTLTLSRNTNYPQVGTPDDSSPYAPTATVLPGQRPKKSAPARTKKAKPARVAAAPKKAAAPKRAKRAAKPKPARTARAKQTARPSSKPKPAASKAIRLPDFIAPGAPKEPQKEMPLPDRARLLGRWLDTHKTATPANVKHWLYQHNWLVYGAKFGWWHGAQALEILVKVDRRVEALWGVGAVSEAEARATLKAVRAKAAG
jgi:beta-lactam-binding protein with PASTA domain